jgi:hypothetical protein
VGASWVVGLPAAAGLGAAVIAFHHFRASIRSALDHAPDITITGQTPLGLSVSVAGHPARVALLPAFLGGDGAPDALADRLRASVPPARIPPFPLVRDRLLPVLKRRDRLPPATGYVLENRVARGPFADDVLLCYVIQGPFQVTYVTEGMLRAWAVDGAALHTLALRNLRAATEHLRQEIGPARRDYLALDGFEAARLLAADLLIPPEIAEPILAIPHEHALLIRPAADAPALAAEAVRLAAAAPLPLTARLFRWTAGGPVALR